MIFETNPYLQDNIIILSIQILYLKKKLTGIQGCRVATQ
jgi:hypothetical protein